MSCLNNVSDDILFCIFRHIPLKTLLNIKSVCHKWNFLVNQMCRRKKVFTLSEELFEGNYGKYPDREKLNGFVDNYLKLYGEYLEEIYFLKPTKNFSIGRNVRDFVARHELNEDLLKGIVKYCPNLRLLDFRKHIFDEFSTFQILRTLPDTLRVLRIDLCRLDEEGNVDETFSDVFKRCFNLEEFSLYGSSYGYLEFSDRAFINFSAKTLKKIDLSGGFSVSITNLQWLRGAKNLIELQLERAEFVDEDLFLLASSCSKLRTLTLAYCQKVTNFAPLYQLKNLHELTLNGNRENFDDFALTQICNGCPNLTSLSLENCRRLTKSSLVYISNLHNLRYLDLCSVPGVDDNCLDWICKHCQNLRTLLIKFCKCITQDGLNIIICNLIGVKTIGCPFTGEELTRTQLMMNNSVVPYRLFPY